MYNRERPALSTVEGLQRAKQLARRLNCDEYDYKWLDCLRAIEDPNLFIEIPDNENIFVITHPVFGTQFLPVLSQKNIEVMAGVVKDEGPLLTRALFPEMTEQLFHKVVRDLSREYHNIDVNEVCDHYLKGVHKTNSSQLKAAFNELFGDLVITCPTYHFAKRLATNGHKLYFYRFNCQSKQFSNLSACESGVVCHGADIDFVFGHPLRNPTLYTETDYDFSIDVMKMWTNFAKTGKAHDVWPQLWDKSVIRVKDLNPNDMSLILDNPYESNCRHRYRHHNRRQQYRVRAGSGRALSTTSDRAFRGRTGGRYWARFVALGVVLGFHTYPYLNIALIVSLASTATDHRPIRHSVKLLFIWENSFNISSEHSYPNFVLPRPLARGSPSNLMAGLAPAVPPMAMDIIAMITVKSSGRAVSAGTFWTAITGVLVVGVGDGFAGGQRRQWGDDSGGRCCTVRSGTASGWCNSCGAARGVTARGWTASDWFTSCGTTRGLTTSG
ncbi:unnamed protein product, partial [Medioppia subpectinata]